MRNRTNRRRTGFTAALCLFGCLACLGLPPSQPKASWCSWTDDPSNPLIQPPSGGVNIIADPTFLPPSQSPDGQWHLFAAAPTIGIFQYTSTDGHHWQTTENPEFPGLVLLRPYIYAEGGTYYLLYQGYAGLSDSEIDMVSSTDLQHWTAPVTILSATLTWEAGLVGNPFLLKRDGAYWLYYSASGVVLPDWTSDTEPLYVGVAQSSALTGPYTKNPEAIVAPSMSDPWRNLGSGSMKLLAQQEGGEWIAFNNGIYLGADGHSHSAIRILSSPDGLAWNSLCPAPILAPTGTGWDSAFVYGFDARPIGTQLWIYFNARDGWVNGVERIGLATATPPSG